MNRGLDTCAAIVFRRELNRAVMQFKKDNPGVLEAITAARHAREEEQRGNQSEGTVQNC